LFYFQFVIFGPLEFVISLFKLNSCSLRKNNFYSINNILDLESFSQSLMDFGTLFSQVCRLETCLSQSRFNAC